MTERATSPPVASGSGTSVGGAGIISSSSGGTSATNRMEIDVITVQIAPEKKGLFLKHSEYEVSENKKKKQ